MIISHLKTHALFASEGVHFAAVTKVKVKTGNDWMVVNLSMGAN